MEKTKYCCFGSCGKEATTWIGYLIKSRDRVSAGFCDEHNAVEKKFHGYYDKTFQLVDASYVAQSSINLIEQ